MVFIDAAIEATTESEPPTAAKRPRRRFRLSRSKKMISGLILLGIFVVLAVIGPIIAPYDPTALGPLEGPPLPGSTVPSQLPGSLHWLGQTTIGGDIFSQLLAGTRPVLIVALLAGAIATLLAIIVGIAAGHIGGLVDEVLSADRQRLPGHPGAAAADRDRCLPRPGRDRQSRWSSA